MSSITSPTLLTLCVRPDGAIEGLHHEPLGLAALGPMDVRRASHVEYDATLQKWYVEDAATGQRLFADSSRADCLAWEGAHFSALLATGLHPFEPLVAP